MTKTDKKSIQENIESVAENVSVGGHLGGTDFGQQPDAKTTSSSDKGGDKGRPNDGGK